MKILSEYCTDLRLGMSELVIALLLGGALHSADWAFVNNIHVCFALEAPNSRLFSQGSLDVAIWLVGDPGGQGHDDA